MKKYILLLTVFCIIVTATGCAPKQYQKSFFAMDTVMNVTVYGKDVTKQIENEVKRLDALLSVTDNNSDIYKLNNTDNTVVCEETAKLISRALEISHLTDGAFDITVEAASQLWNFANAKDIPDKKSLDNAKDTIGYEKVSVNQNDIDCGGAKIGLGAIAKGYAAGCLRDILIENGITSAAISLGGNVLVVGANANGEDWRVGIQHPENPQDIIATVSVKDTSVVTSGGYQRYFEKDGKVYHHILDPETAMPADNGVISSTVITDDDTLADALSTALFVMGVQKASEFYKNNNIEFILVTDNTVYITENIQDSFELSDSDYRIETIKK